jgi:hypothetical protein
MPRLVPLCVSLALATAPLVGRAGEPDLRHIPAGRYGNLGHGDVGSTVLDVTMLGIEMAVAAADKHRGPPPVRRPVPPADARPVPRPYAFAGGPPLVGRIVWQGSGKGVARVPVILQGTHDVVVRRTTTDDAGRFSFAFPKRPDWYVVSVDADEGQGETTVWLQELRPAALVVPVSPRPLYPPHDDDLPETDAPTDGAATRR